MKQPLKILLLTLLVVSHFTCRKKNPMLSEPSRTFYMGVTPWPADFTTAEVNNAYSFINNNCDIVSHHFDEGIPYEEAYTNSNWPVGLIEDINKRVTKTAAGKKILLSSSALALSRNTKAPYSKYSDNIQASLKKEWEQLAFNDPKVVTAYTNFIIYLINAIKPAYINYGVESNLDTWNDADFILYKDFLRQVFAGVKSAYPSIPLMVSFIVTETPQSLAFANQLVPYTDYIALSAYPYTHVSSSANGNTNPALFPADFFTKYINLANDKPFCFAETGYIAEPLLIPFFNLNKQGNEQWQNDYLQMICNLTNERKGKFIIWFCQKDYDAGVRTLKSLGLYQDLFGLWQNTGLTNENNVQRPAYTTWINWMKLKKIE